MCVCLRERAKESKKGRDLERTTERKIQSKSDTDRGSGRKIE